MPFNRAEAEAVARSPWSYSSAVISETINSLLAELDAREKEWDALVTLEFGDDTDIPPVA